MQGNNNYQSRNEQSKDKKVLQNISKTKSCFMKRKN